MGKQVLDPELAKFVPEDTIALAGVRLAEVQSAPVYSKLARRFKTPQSEALAAQTGFDPQRDVRELLIAHNGKDALLIARGSFQLKVPEQTPKTDYRGYVLYGNGPMAFTLMDQTTALAGSSGQVRAAIDQFRAGGRRGGGLIARAQAIPGRNPIWAVADNRLAAFIPESGNASNLRRFIVPLEDLTLVADLGEGVHAALTGNFKTEEDAKNLGVAARGILGLGRLSLPENQPDLARLYDTVSLEQRQKTIKVEATVPGDLVDRFATLTGR